VALFFLDGSYIGLELIENGIANLCLVPATRHCGTHRIRLPGPDDGHLTSALPSLAERLAGRRTALGQADGRVCPTGGHLHRSEEQLSIASAIRLAHIHASSPATALGHRACIARAGGRTFGEAAARGLSCRRRGQVTPVPFGCRASSPASRASSGGRNLMYGGRALSAARPD